MGIFLGGIIDLLLALITGNTVLFLGPEQQKDKTFFIDKEVPVNIIFYIDENRGIICPINTCIKPVITYLDGIMYNLTWKMKHLSPVINPSTK